MKKIGLASLLALLLAASAAQAAGVPNMVGTWKPTGGTGTASARLGDAVSGWPANTKPSFNLQPRPYVVVETQIGREIAGYEVFADSSHEQFVGVFKRNGKDLLISTMKGTALVDVTSRDMEWCWMDNLPQVAVVSCDVMQKTSAAQ
jgi:opacity protein-like surface antigen